MSNIYNYLSRYILSVFIVICFAFPIRLLILPFFESDPQIFMLFFFGFWNGLITGLIPFKFVRKFHKALAFSFLISLSISIFWVVFPLTFNKLAGTTTNTYDAFMLLMIFYFGAVYALPNFCSIYLLKKLFS
jgi:hypothetical protein